MGDLYHGKINEYTDWNTGENTINAQDGIYQQMSGEAIRNLLMEKMQRPFYVFSDNVNYYFFSSSYAYQVWLTDKEKYGQGSPNNLILFQMPKVSTYDWHINLNGSTTRTLLAGSLGDNSLTELEFEFSLKKGELYQNVNLTYVTITIIDNKTSKQTVKTISIDTAGQNVNTFRYDIAEYLVEGKNTVNVTFYDPATYSEGTASLTFNIIKFDLTGKWILGPNGGNNIYYTLSRNNTDIGGVLKIFVFKKDGIPPADPVFQTTLSNTATLNITGSTGDENTDFETYIDSLSAVDWRREQQYCAQMYVELQNKDGSMFRSNCIYWTFVASAKSMESSDLIAEDEESDNKIFINVKSVISTSVGNEVIQYPVQKLKLYGTQYSSVTINYNYYTNNGNKDNQTIRWYLVTKQAGVETLTYAAESKDIISESYWSEGKADHPYNSVTFRPTIIASGNNPAKLRPYLVESNNSERPFPVYDETGKIISNKYFEIDIVLNEGPQVFETAGAITFDAFGKRNDNDTTWDCKVGNVTYRTEFHGIDWSNKTGWFNNSFRTAGINSWAEIRYELFNVWDTTARKGKTIEIEFESEQVRLDDDIILKVGNNAGIRITPVSASVVNTNGNALITTNFKANERIKLCFSLFQSNDSEANGQYNNCIFISNNGILERAVYVKGSLESIIQGTGSIIIGKSPSGIRVYKIRIYDNKALTWKEAYNNYVFDADDKAAIISKNNVLDTDNTISYEKCKNLIDTILISGDLNEIFASSEKVASTATIERYCPDDTSFNFKVVNAQIRKHGQSTLNYPVPSFKIWFNKSSNGTAVEYSPSRDYDLDEYGVKHLKYAKNRYRMKENSIPQNKFVLQANYADSSGCHNGAIERLLNDTWYNAEVNIRDEENTVNVYPKEYKLRTWPQLFASNKTVHPDETIGEGKNGDNFIDGKATVILGRDPNNNEVQLPVWYHSENDKKSWKDITKTDFPYNIRVAPDSFPCVVFYKDTSTSQEVAPKFIGTYVFMDDKKSDFLYGERSMYYFEEGGYKTSDDPFMLKSDNAKNGAKSLEFEHTSGFDEDDYKVWDNANVLRIEVVNLDSDFTSFRSTTTRENNIVQNFGQRLKTGANTYGNIYTWERDFELIYPDPDDLAGNADKGTDKFGENSKFARICQPWIDFHAWVCSTKVEPDEEPTKFMSEAALHLDLYKLAAYYIFFLRFGLVDSVERNCQWKTYDGQHWHCEPWDMDIALGNQNDGGIAFNPPLTRESKLSTDNTIWAYGGRSYKNAGDLGSNTLWDNLEKWPRWRDVIVPQVADALYKAGLTYNKCIEMLDNNYADKWNETFYNESGHFKYLACGNDTVHIDDSNASYLAWLQGARKTHRHWWLSKSMNYYDAKWKCGEYALHDIYITGIYNKKGNVTEYFEIIPAENTFISFEQGGKTQYEEEAFYGSTVRIPLPETMNVKNPCHIYGANSIQYLDVSALAPGLQFLKLTGCWDVISGSNMKSLDMGCKEVASNEGIDTNAGGIFTYTNGKKINCMWQGGQTFNQSDFDTSGDDTVEFDTTTNGNVGNVLSNITYLNVRGLQMFASAGTLCKDLNELEEFYGMGCGISSFVSGNGCKYRTLELCSSLTRESTNGEAASTTYLEEMTFNNSVWEYDGSFTFYDAQIITENVNGNDITYCRNIKPEISGTIDGYVWNETFNIPRHLRKLTFKGTSGHDLKVKQFIFKWIYSKYLYIVQDRMADNLPCAYTDVEPYWFEELHNCQLIIDDIDWTKSGFNSQENINLLTYDQIILLGQLNGGPDSKDALGNVLNHKSDTYNGIIELSPSVGDLTSTQLSHLNTLFGANIFNIKANGLHIDHARNYIQVSISGARENEGRIEVDESLTTEHVLSATKFTLKNNDDEIEWYILDENGNGYQGEFVQRLETGSDKYRYNVSIIKRGGKYLLYVKPTSNPSAIYTIKLRASYSYYDNNQFYNEVKDVTIYVRTVTYPEDIRIEYNEVGGQANIFARNNNAAQREILDDNEVRHTITYFDKRLIGEFYIRFLTNSGVEMYQENNKPEGSTQAITFNATIEDVKYTITDVTDSSSRKVLMNNSSYSNYVLTAANPADVRGISISTDPTNVLNTYKRGTLPYSIVIGTISTQFNNDTFRIYELKCNIKWGSGQTDIRIVHIMVINDGTIILGQNSGDANLLAAMKELYARLNIGAAPAQFFKSDLMNFNGTLDFTSVTPAIRDNIQTYIVGYASNQNGVGKSSIFKYLPNVSRVILSDITIPKFYDNYSISGSTNPVQEIEFSNNSVLKYLDIRNTGLGSYEKEMEAQTNRTIVRKIDLSKLKYFEYIDARGTYVSVIVKDASVIGSYRVGEPQEVSLIEQTQLNAANVLIESTDALTKLQIKNRTSQSANPFALVENILKPKIV